jgi:hypothetical protein
MPEKAGERVAKYELAVVGTGLAGLTAAALACRKNKKTVFLQTGNVDGSYRKNGFQFFPEPALAFGFDRGGPFHHLSEELGLAVNAGLQSPSYQVALPDRRITVYAELTETLEELRREFPREIDRIARFYHDLRKKGLRNSKSSISAFVSQFRKAGSFIRSYRFSPEFTVFLEVQSLTFFGKSINALPLLSLITLFDSTPFFVEGGFRKLNNHMLDVLLKNGADVKHLDAAQDITVGSRELSFGQENFHADSILLTVRQKKRGGILCIGFNENGLPEGMLRDVLYVPDYSHPERFYAVSVSPEGDTDLAPMGMRTITVSYNDTEPLMTDEDRIAQLGVLVPFFSDFGLFADNYPMLTPNVRLPDGVSFKTIRTSDRTNLLSRSSLKGVYMVSNGDGTPSQSIIAARRFIESIK